MYLIFEHQKERKKQKNIRRRKKICVIYLIFFIEWCPLPLYMNIYHDNCEDYPYFSLISEYQNEKKHRIIFFLNISSALFSIWYFLKTDVPRKLFFIASFLWISIVIILRCNNSYKISEKYEKKLSLFFSMLYFLKNYVPRKLFSSPLCMNIYYDNCEV